MRELSKFFLSKIPSSPISKDEGVMLRAIAILAILFHNYLHWVSNSPGENEFNFHPERIQNLLLGLGENPLDAFRLLSTYFGHYGVQVFFFLSGYGIIAKYRNAAPNWFLFQKERLIKLYLPISIAAIGYLIYSSFRFDFGYVIRTEGVNLLRQMLCVSNFIPDNIYHPIGPWWFIAVIVQFYLIAPLVLKGLKRYGEKILYILAASSILLEIFLGDWIAHTFDLNINHTILGHLDVCAFGMWLSWRKNLQFSPVVMLIAFALFIAGNFYPTLWILTGITGLLFFLPLIRIFTFKNRNRYLMWMGHLSMYLFLCNGYLREPLIQYTQDNLHWWTSIWTSFLFLAICILWALIMRFAEQQCHKLLRSNQ